MLILAAGACRPAARQTLPPEVAEQAAPGSLAEYLALEGDTVMAYDTLVEGGGERGTIIVQVAEVRPGRFELMNGGHTETLDVTPEEIRLVRGGFLLKAPLRVGACWTGRQGEVCVASVDRAITVPAGTYSGCIETVEQTREAGTRSVFCRGVGLVLLEVTSEATQDRERALLRSRAHRVDIFENPPE